MLLHQHTYKKLTSGETDYSHVQYRDKVLGVCKKLSSAVCNTCLSKQLYTHGYHNVDILGQASVYQGMAFPGERRPTHKFARVGILRWIVNFQFVRCVLAILVTLWQHSQHFAPWRKGRGGLWMVTILLPSNWKLYLCNDSILFPIRVY